MTMDRLLTLEVFTAVVEKGSFVAAARALDLSPASVTEHIQALERRLKTKLLNRTTRRIALTEEGAAYFEHCKQMLARMEEADGMLAAQRTSPKGTLRVQGPQVLVNGILLPDVAIPRALPRAVCGVLHLRGDARSRAAEPRPRDPDQPRPEPGRDLPADRPVRGAHLRFARVPGKARHPAASGRARCAQRDRRAQLARGVPATFRFEQDGRMISRNFPSRITVDLGDGPALAALAGVGIGQSYHYAVAHLIEATKSWSPVLEDWRWSGPPLGAVHLPNRFLSPRSRCSWSS